MKEPKYMIRIIYVIFILNMSLTSYHYIFVGGKMNIIQAVVQFISILFVAVYSMVRIMKNK